MIKSSALPGFDKTTLLKLVNELPDNAILSARISSAIVETGEVDGYATYRTGEKRYDIKVTIPDPGANAGKQ